MTDAVVDEFMATRPLEWKGNPRVPRADVVVPVVEAEGAKADGAAVDGGVDGKLSKNHSWILPIFAVEHMCQVVVPYCSIYSVRSSSLSDFGAMSTPEIPGDMLGSCNHLYVLRRASTAARLSKGCENNFGSQTGGSFGFVDLMSYSFTVLKPATARSRLSGVMHSRFT